MRARSPIFASVCGLLLLAGCASTRLYDGPPRSEEEVVQITGMSGLDPLGGHTSALVCSLDGVPIEGCAVRVEFLPGHHTLELKIKRYGLEYGTQVIEQPFAPGDRYHLGVGIAPASGEIFPALIPADPR